MHHRTFGVRRNAPSAGADTAGGRIASVNPGFDYVVIGCTVLFSLAFVAAVILLSNLLAPHNPTPKKLEPYECGSEPIGAPWVRFRMGYYVYALLFVIFDIETVFLYPWAVVYNQMGLFILVEMVVFILILAAGLAYAWREGALTWR